MNVPGQPDTHTYEPTTFWNAYLLPYSQSGPYWRMSTEAERTFPYSNETD